MTDTELDGKVLIVDDEPGIRGGCRRILTSCGARVEMAENGQEAMTRLRAEPFDVAVVDLIMPSLGGMEVLDGIAAADLDVVPIVITAHASFDTAIEAVKRGAFDYLPKPFAPLDLITRVERALRFGRVRDQARQRLLELNTEKTRLHTIVTSLADGVLVANRDGQVVLSNPAARAALRMEGPADEPRSVEDLIEDEGLCRTIRSVAEAGPDDPSSRTVELRRADRVYMARVVPIRTTGGDRIGTTTVLRDVTELMSLERAKAQFMRMVAHELKSPLAAVQGYLKVILGGQELPDDKLHSIVARSSERVEGMAQLVRDLLELSQADAVPMREIEALDLREIIAEVVEANHHLAETNEVDVQVAVPTDCPTIHADRDDIARLLMNLLSNAIKYNRPGGQATLAVRPQGDALRIDVADTGLGIPEEALPRLGEEFYRVSAADRKGIVGTGLGLSLVKRIIEAYHGRLEVQSTPGAGSTFSVFLPLGEV